MEQLRFGREVIVGTLVLIAIAVFVFGSMWLSGRSVSTADLVQIRFADASGLKRASPVRVSGIAVGKVEKLEFKGVGNVLASISLPDDVEPRTDATALITSISLVGDYAIDFNPGKGPALPKGQVLTGGRATELSAMAAGLSGRADTVLAGLQQVVSPEMVEKLQLTLSSLQGTMAAAQRTMAIYGNAREGPTAELTRTMVQFRELSEQLNTTLANPALQRTISNSDSLTANFSAMAKSLAATSGRMDSLLARVNAGEGSLGKFATDSALYWAIVKATGQLDSLMAEIKKNPGKIPITIKLF